MKIIELMESLSHAMKTLGADAEVIVRVGDEDCPIDALVECRNKKMPDDSTSNALLIRPVSYL